MQHPTCTNTRIRSVNDVHKILYAVRQGFLQMITRRLDADERAQLRSGCIYVWQERGPHAEVTGNSIERFTDGRRWSPSRVREEFLFYFEKYLPPPDCTNPNPPPGWLPLVKQTYSVWVETERGRRKWHLTSYYIEDAVDTLITIDDMRVVCNLSVPQDVFKPTRAAKGRNKNDDNRAGSSQSASTANPSRYAPFPAPTIPTQPESSGQILMYQPYPNHDTLNHQENGEANPPSVQLFSSTRTSNANFRGLDQHRPSRMHNYRPLLPSTHARNTADHFPRNVREYTSVSQQVPVSLGWETQQTSTSLSQARSGREHIVSHPLHPPIGHLPVKTSLAIPAQDNVLPYTSNSQPLFPAVSTSGWIPVASGNPELPDPSIYYGDVAAGLTSSAAAPAGSSFPPLYDDIPAGTGPGTFQPMAPYLNPLLDLAEHVDIPREPLPSLSMLHETYSFSYDLSIAMVTQTVASSIPESLNNGSSASDPLQKTASGVNKPSGLSGDLDLAPLNSLSRRQTYRREPMDDRALRKLWPRSP